MAEKIGRNVAANKKIKPGKGVGRNTVKGRSIGAAILTILSAPAGFKIGQNTKKELRKAMASSGPKKKRSKAKTDRETAPFKRKQKNIAANKQVRSIKESKAATREGQRGKVGPKRNVIKTKSGVLRDKSGKAVKGGSKSAFQKRMEERKAGGGR